MNNKRKLRKTKNIYKEAYELLRESENFLVMQSGYDYIDTGKEVSQMEIKALIAELVEQEDAIKKDASRWIAQINRAIKKLGCYVKK